MVADLNVCNKVGTHMMKVDSDVGLKRNIMKKPLNYVNTVLWS